jgi:Zn-dependent protease with chaperone function
MRSVSWHTAVFGFAVLATLVMLGLSLALGGWVWPVITVLMLLGCWVFLLLFPVSRDHTVEC